MKINLHLILWKYKFGYFSDSVPICIIGEPKGVYLTCAAGNISCFKSKVLSTATEAIFVWYGMDQRSKDLLRHKQWVEIISAAAFQLLSKYIFSFTYCEAQINNLQIHIS